jgi:hypothetical protein
MEYEVKLTHEAVAACNNCLVSLEPKGRTELRAHSKICRALKSECFENIITAEKVTQIVSKEGKLKLGEDLLEYLQSNLEERIKKGIPGALSIGYMDLLDALLACVDQKKA